MKDQITVLFELRMIRSVVKTLQSEKPSKMSFALRVGVLLSLKIPILMNKS